MEEKLHVIKSKMFALTSVLLPKEMLSYEPEVFLNGLKYEVRINILKEVKCDIDLHQMVIKST